MISIQWSQGVLWNKIRLLRLPTVFFHIYGPEKGRLHETTLYCKSFMDQILCQALHFENEQHCVYSDAAYVLRPWCQVGFERVLVTCSEALQYDAAISVVRTAVEWTYNDILQAWTMLGFKRKFKIREAPYELCWIARSLLWNWKVV